MYHSPELKIDISFPKVLVICITIFATLVIPIQIHLYMQSQGNKSTVSASTQTNITQTGSVAGASTVRSSTIDFLGLEIDKDAAPYFIAGFFFLGVSSLIIIFLVADSNKYKEYNLAYETNQGI